MAKGNTCPRCAAALAPGTAKCPRCALDLNAAFSASAEAGATIIGDESSSTDDFQALTPDATMVDPEEAPTTAADVPDTGEQLAHEGERDTGEQAMPDLLQPGGEVITDKRVAFEAVEAARAMPSGAQLSAPPPVIEEGSKGRGRPLTGGGPAVPGPVPRRTVTGERPIAVPRRSGVVSNAEAKKAAVPHEPTPAPKRGPLSSGRREAAPITGTSDTMEPSVLVAGANNGTHEVPRIESFRPPERRPVPQPGQRAVDSLINAQLGEYIIAERIGVGGMGIVYRAKQPLIGTSVAIKVLRPDVLADPRDVERLLHEAKVVNQIKHRGIISIFGAGALPDGRQYLVMEYLEGETLEKRLEREGRLKPEVAVPILDEVLAALGAAHDAGIVHRDLKPANVFLIRQSDGRPWVKLLDFGLARRNTNDVSRIAGTPDYISPEHARGRPAGPPTDIYAVGILAFHRLTGQLPFKGNTPMEVMEKHVHSPPPDPASINPEIPPILAGFALKLLEKDPAKRPDAKQARKDLKAAFKDLNFSQMNLEPVASSPSSVMPDRPLVHTVGVSESEVDPRLRDLARRADRAKILRLAVQHWPWIAGVVAILWVLGVAIYLIATPAPGTTPPKPVMLPHPNPEVHGPPGPPLPLKPAPDKPVKPAVVEEAPKPALEVAPPPEKPPVAEEKPPPPAPVEEKKEEKPPAPPPEEKHAAHPAVDPDRFRSRMGDEIDAIEARLDEKLTTDYKPALENLRNQVNAAEPAQQHELTRKLADLRKKIADAAP